MGDRNRSEQLREEAERILEGMEPALRRAVFERLRREIGIHPLEQEWNTSAEAILEAISRSSSLTQSGIRGVLAEASFIESVLPRLERAGFRDATPQGDIPYDFALQDGVGLVRVQVKLQRSRDGRPMTGNEAVRALRYAAEFFVVETQKTRGGTRQGQATRPYRFGEFDILAVSMYPSTGNWNRFLYTVAKWLVRDPADGRLICKYQPVPPAPNGDWTDDVLVCITWFREGTDRIIGCQP